MPSGMPASCVIQRAAPADHADYRERHAARVSVAPWGRFPCPRSGCDPGTAPVFPRCRPALSGPVRPSTGTRAARWTSGWVEFFDRCPTYGGWRHHGQCFFGASRTSPAARFAAGSTSCSGRSRSSGQSAERGFYRQPGDLQPGAQRDQAAVVRASVIATIVAIVFNYIGFRYFTYRDRDRGGRTKEMGLFVLFSAVGLVIENGVLYVATYGFGWDSPLQSNIFKFLGIGIATLFRFWSYRTWVFRTVPDEAREVLESAEALLDEEPESRRSRARARAN